MSVMPPHVSASLRRGAPQTRIDAYRTIVNGSQQTKAQKTSLTSTLATEFDRALMLLEDLIDGLMEQLKGDGSSFYDDYHNARKIIDNFGPGKKDDGTPPPTP